MSHNNIIDSRRRKKGGKDGQGCKNVKIHWLCSKNCNLPHRYEQRDGSLNKLHICVSQMWTAVLTLVNYNVTHANQSPLETDRWTGTWARKTLKWFTAQWFIKSYHDEDIQLLVCIQIINYKSLRCISKGWNAPLWPWLQVKGSA